MHFVSQSQINSDELAKLVFRAMHHARIGITMTLVQGEQLQTVHLNDVAAEILGYSREELLTRPPLANLAPEEGPKIAAFRERVKNSLSYSLDTVIVQKTGTRVPIRVAVCKVPFENAYMAVSFLWDISEQKQTNKALESSQQRLKTLFESAPNGIVILQEEFVRYANPSAVRLFGAEDSTVLLSTPLPQLPLDVKNILFELHQTKPALVPRSFRLQKPSGKQVLIEFTSVPFEYDDRPAILAFAREVTDRERMRDEMARIERLAALGTMAAGVAHEVNNPLAVALTSVDAIQSAIENGAPVHIINTLLQEVRSGIQRASAIVNDLRGFSRTSDKVSIVHVNDVINNCLKVVQSEIRYKANLHFEPSSVHAIHASEGRIEQVIVNLLLNASQAFTEANPQKNFIQIRTFMSDTVCIEVSDNGPGIPLENAPHLFDPFFTTKPVGIGTGLGLTICHNIVTEYGGSISVVPSNKGATFHVCFPIAKTSESQALRAPSLSLSSQRSRLRCLVIDNERGLALSLKYLLDQDHDATVCFVAQDALTVLRQSSEFDVVFCDLQMPSMTGMELFERIVEEKPFYKNRFVFMTGGATHKKAAQFLERLRTPKLEKPFSLQNLENVLQQFQSNMNHYSIK